MPNKRSNRKTQKFHCVHCQKRLWRPGKEKHYLFYSKASDIKDHLNISRKRANIIAENNRGYLDTNSWIEEFICEVHGKIWLLITKQADGKLEVNLAKSKDWNRTTNTINPDVSNPSVSEFSRRISRKAASEQLTRYY